MTVACQAPLPWNFPGKNTGVSCHFRLQGIFPTQGSNLHLLHQQVYSLPPAPPGKPDSRGIWYYFCTAENLLLLAFLVLLSPLFSVASLNSVKSHSQPFGITSFPPNLPFLPYLPQQMALTFITCKLEMEKSFPIFSSLCIQTDNKTCVFCFLPNHSHISSLTSFHFAPNIIKVVISSPV